MQITGIRHVERWYGRVGLGFRRDLLRRIARFLQLGRNGIDVSCGAV